MERAIFALILIVLLATIYRFRRRLKHTEIELDALANHAPAAIAHVERVGGALAYRFVNTKYAELYGRKPADVIGKHPRDVLEADVFARAEGNMRRALNGETVTFDLALGERTIEVVYHPDRRGTGAIAGFIGVITDVTELRKLQSRAN